MKLTFAFSIAILVITGSLSLWGEGDEVAPGVLQMGTIQSAAISESSGLIPSRRAKGVYWTHNDGGADTIYGITADGMLVSEFKIEDTRLENCEDIAATPGRLYLADIGNNDRNRQTVAVYAVPEPRPKGSGEIGAVRHWTLSYPEEPFDAESLILSRGAGYLIAKELTGGEARVFKFPLGRKGNVTLKEQCRIDVNAPVGGADLTADSRRLAVITREGAYLFRTKGRIPAEGKLEPSLFVPFAKERMEGCCFTRDGLLVTAESGEIYLFTDPQFRLRGR